MELTRQTVDALNALHKATGATLRCSVDDYIATMVDHFKLDRATIVTLFRLGWYTPLDGGGWRWSGKA